LLYHRTEHDFRLIRGDLRPLDIERSEDSSINLSLNPKELSLLTDDRASRWMRWAMASFYLAAGVLHLQAPGGFLPIMPDWVPAPREVILLTGVCEIVGALGLLTRSFRWWAAVMLALYAVCVFPANIKHAFEDVQLPQLPSSWWYHAPRLALQPVIVWWALYCGRVIGWPFRRAPGIASRELR
jgi:uncharacterized membrane protein